MWFFASSISLHWNESVNGIKISSKRNLRSRASYWYANNRDLHLWSRTGSENTCFKYTNLGGLWWVSLETGIILWLIDRHYPIRVTKVARRGVLMLPQLQRIRLDGYVRATYMYSRIGRANRKERSTYNGTRIQWIKAALNLAVVLDVPISIPWNGSPREKGEWKLFLFTSPSIG